MSRHATRQIRLFGPCLKAHRERAGLTQEQLAPKAGVTLRTIQRWEGGESEPTFSQLGPIARAVGVSLADLIEEQAA